MGEEYSNLIGVHHSSLSRDIRLSVEDKLKNNELLAVVSSTSLELGIDIGSVKLVAQIGSPKSVAKYLQRVGRSGHRLDKISKGYVITEDLNDTLEAIVIVNRIRTGWLEPLKILEKPYDVLCHQIVSLMFVPLTYTF